MRSSAFLNGIPALVVLLLAILLMLGLIWVIIRLLPYLIMALGLLIAILLVVYLLWKMVS